MRAEGLIGIIVLGLMCLVGIGLVFLDSSIPVLIAIVLGAIFSVFIVLEKKKAVKNKVNAIRYDIKDEFRIIANSAENMIRTADEIKRDLEILKGVNVKYVGSVNSNKFHRPSCRLAKNISKDNQVWFPTKIDALKHGFVECKAVEV